jgi:two-component system chemotaxis sensor kinase CheA
MSGLDPHVLDRLRRVFFAELEDQLERLGEVCAGLAESELDPTTLLDRVTEAARILHTIKGAAGSVAFVEPEALCHTLEERLGNLRDGDPEGRAALSAILSEGIAVSSAKAGKPRAPI